MQMLVSCLFAVLIFGCLLANRFLIHATESEVDMNAQASNLRSSGSHEGT
jgi:hypothetical protein